MDNITVADKATSQVTSNAWGNVQLQRPGIVEMPVAPDQVASVHRAGQNLQVTLKSGEQVTVNNFFDVSAEGVRSDMVFQGEDGALWQAQYTTEGFTGFTFEEIASLDELLAGVAVVGSATPEWAIAGLGLLGAGGAAAAASGVASNGGGGSDDAVAPIDPVAPVAPSGLTLSADGLFLSGLGLAGATVNVRDANGNVLGTAIVGADGTFSVPLNSAQLNGETLVVGQTDTAGNTSPDATFVAPDVTAPTAPSDLLLNDDGTVLTGRAEAGSTVQVRSADGTVLGSAVVAADGTFSLTLSPAQTDGQVLQVSVTDAAGNESAGSALTAPDIDTGTPPGQPGDITPPTAPTQVSISGDGVLVGGRGEVGATVIVTDALGNLVGTGTVGSDGLFSVTLTPTQSSGQVLQVVLVDAAGNISPNVELIAPNLDPLATPTELVVSNDGLTLTGVAQVGTRVLVRDAAGNVLGATRVGPDGTFSVTLDPAQINGQLLDVIATDAAGNNSAPGLVTSPDGTAPDAVDGLVFSPDGALLSGRGEAGATVTVRDGNGTALGTAVVTASGDFVVALSPAPGAGVAVEVTQADAAGNTSPIIDATVPLVPGPVAPDNLALDGTGTLVTGSAPAGTVVQVRDADGNLLGSATVNPDGSFTVPLGTAQVNGELLTVVAVDANGASSISVPLTAADITAPDPATDLYVNPNGQLVSGRGEPGATVTVTDAQGTVLGTGVVTANGGFAVTLSPSQIDGQSLQVVLSDAAGNPSAPAGVLAGDLNGPLQPADLSLDATSTLLSGVGEAGSTVTVRDSAGNVLGSAAVGADGRFTVTLNTPQANGQTLQVTALDAAGNSSAAVPFTGADVQAPNAVGNLALDANGALLTGTGEPGATVTVRDPAGSVIGSLTVDPDGNFSVALNPAQTEAQLLQVVQSDAAGNVSTPVDITAPDLLVPQPVLNLAISTNGAVVSGNGEPGARVTVTDADGNPLGSATVGSNGRFEVTLTTPQTNGQLLSAVQQDTAATPSSAATVQAPDLDAPLAPTNLRLSDDGLTLTGNGEPDAQVTIRVGTVTVGTATVNPDGTFTVLFATPQADGERLLASQADAVGHVSPNTVVLAPDTTASPAPTGLSVSANGALLTGLGTAGETVNVRLADGTLIGTALVGSNGGFTVGLSPAPIDGQLLSITQTDGTNTSVAATATAPDFAPPAAATDLAVATDGSALTGKAEVGTLVEVRDATTGAVLGTATVNANGDFSFALTPPLTNGESLQVVVIDGQQTSLPATSTAPDTTPPAPVTDLQIAPDGTSLSGVGQPGSTVTVQNPAGTTLGTVVVPADGVFVIPLTPAAVTGDPLTVVAADPGGTSIPAVLPGPTGTELAAPTNLAVAPDGFTLTGNATAGTRVFVVDSNNVALGDALVASNGSFRLVMRFAQLNAQTLHVTATDGAGKTSVAGTVIAADSTAPDAPAALAINSNGTAVTGRGEAGATVTVRAPDGSVVGTGLVTSAGTFAVVLTTPQSNAQLLSVTLTDPATNVSLPNTVTAPNLDAPSAPTGLSLNTAGTVVSGQGEAGATVTVRDANGVVLGTATVDQSGNFQVPLTTAQLTGTPLQVQQADTANNLSVPASLATADRTPPDAVTDPLISGDGATVTGSGEPGATVNVRLADGTLVGTGTVDVDGQFRVTVSPAANNGQQLDITQADPSGNVSTAVVIDGPDISPPAALSNVAVNADGVTVTGLGEPGATVYVRGVNGAELGTALVGANGAFTVSLSAIQNNAQLLTVNQEDPPGNEGPAVSVTAPDTVAPDIPTQLALNTSGVQLVGRGEAGSTITVRDAAGNALGTATATSNGTFQVTLSGPQLNGQALSVTSTDAAGNVSLPAPYNAGDTTAPLAASNLAVNAAGNTLSGFGEAGATVNVSNGTTALGTAVVGADGRFTVTLNPPAVTGSALTVVQVDGANNTSLPASVTAPGGLAPAAPSNLLLSADGLTLTGSADAGNLVSIRGSNGALLGSVRAGNDGTFSATLTSAQLNGQVLSATATSTDGLNSLPTALTAVDSTPPAALTNTVLNADGVTLTGRGEAGATVTVLGQGGVILGSGQVSAAGTFSITLSPAQLEGQVLSLSQQDGAQNESPTVSVIAPDQIAPIAPSGLVLGGQGGVLSGTGEAGATVTVVNGAGTVLGTGVVQANGQFQITVTPAQANGEALSVTLTDAAGNVSPSTALLATDTTAPGAVTELAIANDGQTITGRGEPGATVSVAVGGQNIPVTVIVGPTGAFTLTLPDPLTNAQVLTLTQADGAGNVSQPANLSTPDFTPPDPLAGVGINAAGTLVTGTGEPGATVTVRDPAGLLLGTGSVQGDGTFAVTLTPAQVNEQLLSVQQADPPGNVSDPVTVLAPDLTPPEVPGNLLVSASGAELSGTGEVGAAVRVTLADGTEVGTGTVDANGNFLVALAPAQTNGQALTVVLADGLLVSGPGSALAPDTTAPASIIDAAVDASGSFVNGTAEAGATVFATNAAGDLLGTTVANADGSFSIGLTPAQTNGQTLTLIQQDLAGNPSLPATALAPDFTAPAAPTVDGITADGLQLTGTAEANARIEVRDANNALIGTATANNLGAFTVDLATAQLNGEVLQVVQIDTGNNPSLAQSVTAGDTTAPVPMTDLALSPSGLQVTGRGEAGATVTVTLDGAAPGAPALGTTTVAADGTFTVNLTSAQLNGQALSVVQADVAGNAAAAQPLLALDSTAPVSPTVTALNLNGAELVGTAEAGSTVTVRAADGTILGSGVATAGVFTIALNPAQFNGEQISLVARDAAGNLSTPLAYSVADGTPPAPVTALSINADHTVLTGLGEALATVTVSRNGIPIGSAQVGADGTFAITLDPAPGNSEQLSIVQTDLSDNASDAATLTVPTQAPPAAPLDVVLDAGGTVVTGSAVAGSTIKVYGANGAVISVGTVTVGQDGTFTADLSPAQTNGQILSVTASTPLGGESAGAALTAGDTTAPAPLSDLVLDATGLIVTGRGEAGATVTVRGPDGATLGTAIVALSGTFTVTFAPGSAQLNGQVLSAIQTDAATNVSDPVTVTARDTVAPDVPVASLAAGGLLVSGTGEANATVLVRDANGVVLQTGTVGADGTFSVTLPTAQLNGQALTVVLRDASGNVSSPAGLLAADTTAPNAPAALVVNATGSQLSGTGEAGATVAVTGPDGAPLGTALVGANGVFTVALTTAQLNGQLLSVRQTDAAGNTSGVGVTSSVDITAPGAPTAAVAADGLSVTGTAEAGATVTVYSGATLLGTVVAGPTGGFTVALGTAQLDGQVLTVRQADVAGNLSAAASATAPDVTAPAAPLNATINASGTQVTGTGLAGARIFVRSAAGDVLGVATVAANGAYTVVLSPAQINVQVLAVTQVDAANNASSALSVTAPDLTPPAAATPLAVSADGSLVTGRGEAGATVTIKSSTGVSLGTGTVQPDGNFSVQLNPLQDNAQTLTVTLTDAAGNVSLGATVVAPDVDVNTPVVASDNLATATVTLAPVVATRFYTDSFSTLLSGFSKAFTFTVASGTKVDPTLTLTTDSAVALLNGAVFVLQVKDASGNWVTLNAGSNTNLLQVVLLTGGAGVRVDLGDLIGGDYRVVVSSTGIGLLTTVNTTFQLDTTNLTQFTGLAGAAVTGNVITDVGTDGTRDITGPDNGAVLQVLKNGVYVTVTPGTTVQGLYGTLTIDAQGNYTYRANGSASSVGKVDVFTYQLAHSNGLSDSANLYVRIDSPQAIETWDSTNLAAPAIVVDATNDIASSSVNLSALTTTNTIPLGTVITVLGGGSNSWNFSVAANTVSDLTVTVSAGSVLTLLGGLSVGLYKLNTATGQFELVKSWVGGNLLSLGGGTYGATVDDQTAGVYQVRAALTGVSVLGGMSVAVINAATSTNQFSVTSYTPVAGNLLTDTAGGGADITGSAYTVLSVLAAGVYVTPGYNGTVVAGTYGNLLVKADGSYTYTLNSGTVSEIAAHQETFSYQLTHPNGTTDTATLTVNLEPAGATTSARLASFSVEDDTSSLASAHVGTEVVLTGTDGNDTLDGSHGGAVTLHGGAGNDTLIIVDQQFASVDGGTGTDTLLWAGGDASINLGNLAARLHNIEVIDLNDTSAVNLTLSLSDLVAITDTGNDTLMIKGSQQDSVHMTGTWAQAGTQLSEGVEYTQYTPQEDPTHHLWVQNGIQVV